MINDYYIYDKYILFIIVLYIITDPTFGNKITFL